MEGIKEHLQTLIDGTENILEITKKAKLNNHRKANKLLKMVNGSSEYIDLEKVSNDLDVVAQDLARQEKEVYALKKILYRLNSAMKFTNLEETVEEADNIE